MRRRKSLSSQLALSSSRKASREARILFSMTSLPISSNFPLSSDKEGAAGGAISAFFQASMVALTQMVSFS